MKIAIIPGAFFPDPGGAQVQAHNLSNIFNKKKIQSDILLLNKTNIKKKNYKIKYLNKFIINLVFIFDYYSASPASRARISANCGRSVSAFCQAVSACS